jgi:hypothetical protein
VNTAAMNMDVQISLEDLGFRLILVAHAYNPRYLGDRDRRTTI